MSETLSLVPTQAFIYIIRNETTGHYKIGRSRNPKIRGCGLQGRTSDRLDMIGYYSCDDAFLAERWLHRTYDHKRITGEFLNEYKKNGLTLEWFCLNTDDIRDIEYVVTSGFYDRDRLKKTLPLLIPGKPASEIVPGFGYRLRKLRQHHDLTQVQLSERSHVGQKDISAYERGRNRNMMAVTLIRLADALGVSTDYLLGRAEK